ncbi:MAG: sigma-70 family RNA polymerase sigma factor [Verrucomicrobiales bacterium]
MTPEPPSLDEDDLLRRTAQGDRAAFAQIYDQMAGGLYGLALQMLEDAHEAEALLQEVFLQIWRRAADFRTADGRAFFWAAKILRNRAIVRLRARLGHIRHQGAPRPAFAIDALPAADQVPTSRETATLVRRGIFQLSDEQRRPIELAFFGGFTHEEISHELKEPLGAVKAGIRRGLLKLRDALKDLL